MPVFAGFLRLASVLPQAGTMTNSLESTRMLRWVFHRGTQAVTCEIDASRTRGYDVCLVPHWNVSASVIERFGKAPDAFRRHAEVALRLREAGWVRDRAPLPAERVGIAA
jgi:hypothetical protein